MLKSNVLPVDVSIKNYIYEDMAHYSTSVIAGTYFITTQLTTMALMQFAPRKLSFMSADNDGCRYYKRS